MKKLFFIPLLFLSLTAIAACSEKTAPTPETERPLSPDRPSGNSKTLVAYFSAEGHTQAVAERIVKLIGADMYRIEATHPYAENPYDDSNRIQNEAYNDLRPGVANLPDKEMIAKYDTIFVGSPCWWHQPAMVVCTFLEAYDLKDKVIIPFFTYGATTYLNESMQKIYKVTPDSKHIPETLPEDLQPDDITTPGPPDDAGIDMPGSANGTEAWLRRIKIIE
ncbi:flavodoxin [Bacteroides sp.]|uniref:flavodoxin n=1 Tax=Bacteroides sp. TaxID=29523 RepID=UPI0025BC1417|nr:flavodoxin [Bacteroides sp.]